MSNIDEPALARLAEVQRLRELRAEGVQCAMFGSDGQLTSVSFFPVPPPPPLPPPPPKKETIKQREARELAEKEAEDDILYGSAGA